MKKNLFYAGMLLLGMTVATSCSNEETLEQVASSGKTVQAVIEKATEARTSVSDNYEVLWTTGDQFDVWSETEKVGTLELKSGEGTTSASFGLPEGADEFEVEEGMTAFFPSNAEGIKGYTFATSYTNQETDAPMLGTFANGKFTFELLTAMVRVVVTDVPQGTAVLTISSDNVNLTGEAALDDDALGLSADGGKEVTVTISNNTENTLTFDVPVPANNYSGGLNVKLTVGNDVVFDKKTNEFTAEIGKIYVFGATYVSTDDDNVQATLQEALENGEAVILTGEAEEVSVPSLELPANTTASLDLNNKKLVLGEATVLAAKAAGDNTIGITNNGTLTLSNGDIEYKGGSASGIAIDNKGVLNLSNVDLTSDGFCIKQAGTWKGDANNPEFKLDEQGDITVTTTIEGGTIISNTSHSTGTHTYALYGLDNSKFIVKNATINGDGAIAINCAHVELTNVTSTATCTGSAYNLYMEAAATATVSGCTFTANSGIKVYAYDNWNAKYGTITYNGEVKTTGVISSTNSALTALQTAFANGGEYTLSENVTLTEALSLSSGKTLNLNLGTSKITGQIVNNGTLTIKGGTIEYTSGSASGIAITNKGVLALEGTDVESDGFCIKQAGTWKGDADNPEFKLDEQGDITVTTTIERGTITSNTSHSTGTHTYALYGIDNSKFIVKDATVNGDGAIAINCAHVELTNVTSTATCTTSAYNLYMEAAATATVTNCNFIAGSGVNVFAYDNWGTKYGDITYNESPVDMTNKAVVIERQQN